MTGSPTIDMKDEVTIDDAQKHMEETAAEHLPYPRREGVEPAINKDTTTVEEHGGVALNIDELQDMKTPGAAIEQAVHYLNEQIPTFLSRHESFDPLYFYYHVETSEEHGDIELLFATIHNHNEKEKEEEEEGGDQ